MRSSQRADKENGAPRSSPDAPASVPSCWLITAFPACVILPQMNHQPMCIWMVKPPFTQYIPIGAGTHLDGKFFVWLRQKLLKSVRIPASFFLARQKFFLPICIPSPIGTASKSLFRISPHTSWRRIFRPDFVKNPCNPPGLRRLFALLDKKSPRQSPHAEILNRL